MLTLEQVRAVNDGFKSGDLNAALRPLEETIDLRSNELPRLDSQATASLKKGLQDSDNAATWAQALLHPNISVRRFARKVFMGMGDEAALLFDPLRQNLERYWSEIKPLADTNKPREAQLRREQYEMVQSAVEILLRAAPEKFMEFYGELLEAIPVGEKDSNTQALQQWQERNRKVWEANQKEVDRLLTEEWGSEWVDSNKRWKLPSRVLRDINERARNSPAIAELWAELGPSPLLRGAIEWRPANLLFSAFSDYLVTYNSTAPRKKIAARVRPTLWHWAENAFNFESSSEERASNARRLMGDRGWGFGNLLGSEKLRAEAPPLLLRAKTPLLKFIEARLADKEGLYGDAASEGDELVARFWLMLVWAVANDLRRPYNVSAKDWDLPAGVDADVLRQLTADLEANQSSQHIFNNIEESAKAVEETRKAQREGDYSAEATENAIADQNIEEDQEIPTDGCVLSPYEALPSELLQKMYEGGYTDEALAKVNAELKKVEQGMNAIEGVEQRVKTLEQPPRLEHGNSISRMNYWKVWSRALGENGGQKLKESIWKEAEPQLWELLDAKLEEYRRIETDPVDPVIEKKLTANELKEWKTQLRREARNTIAFGIWDVANLLFQEGGFEARLKAIKLADRPSCRDLAAQMETGLIAEIERFPGDYRSGIVATPADWQQWKIGEEWDVVLEMAEAQLAKAKDEWARTNLSRQLATGYYRRGNFDRFKEMATRPNVFPMAVAAAAVALDDFEAWHVLIGSDNRWSANELTTFWTAQMKEPQKKARAIDAVVHALAVTNNAEVARRLLTWMGPVANEELASFVPELEQALESALMPVKKWAMSVLAGLEGADYDRERAATTAGEALWNENAGLAKDAAKFLSQISKQDPEVSQTAWDALCDATALDNVGVSEAVYRALSQIKTKNKALELPESAREKLESLVSIQADRFAKFEKKLV